MWNKLTFSYIFFFFLLSSFLFMGCQTPDQCGVIDGAFRHQYWHYYTRGISYAQCKQLIKAESDFKEAIVLEKEDKRRKRTYGAHFIDYFPHRELGVVLFFQKRYSEAIKALVTSLSFVKTAKAEFYLDKCRFIQITQNNKDHHPPSLSIHTPNQNAITNMFQISVTGKASDDTFVKRVSINDIPVRIDLAKPDISFNVTIPIKHGVTIVKIEVEDIVGKQTHMERTITCDTTGPVLSIDAIVKNQAVLIDGYAYDASGIEAIRILDHRLSFNMEKELVFKQTIDRPGNQEYIKIIAEDAAGNFTHATIKLPDTADNNFFQRPLYASRESLYSFAFFSKMRNKVYYKSNYPILLCNHDRGGGTAYSETINNKGALGNYHALLIGINAYQQWNPLKTAVSDAKAMKNLLVTKYAFFENNVTMLIDKEATRANISEQLRNIVMALNNDDNLLIYYAGHGNIDKELTDEGYWIPVEGKQGEPTTWITHSVIQKILTAEKNKGKNIIVISDSCYAGKLMRQGGISTISESNKVYEQKLLELASKRSRQVITSGGIETVSDRGRDGHSVFAYSLLNALEKNQNNLIDLERFFLTRVLDDVARKSTQRPQSGRFGSQMDEDGQFILPLKSYWQSNDKSVSANEKPSSLAINKPQKTYDTLPPEMTIKRWEKETKTIFLEKAFFEGHAFDESGIQCLRINGRNILNRPGKNVYFNCLENLDPGKNNFIIECEDQIGNTRCKKIVIHRKLQETDQIGSRMSLEISPIETIGNDLPEIEEVLRRELLSSKRFQIKEYANPNKNTCDVEFTLKGKTIVKDDSVTITIRIIEKEMSHILTISEVYGEGEHSKSFIDKLCKGLSLKIVDDLPVIKGQVVQIFNQKIIIDLGSQHGIKQGMHLIFYEKGQPVFKPGTNIILDEGVNIEIGTARVDKTKSKIAFVVTFKNDIISKIKEGMSLVMK